MQDRLLQRDEPRILVLTGPSSAGKTSALEALRRVSRIPAILLPADAISIPPDARSRDLLGQADETEQLSVHRAMFRAYYRSLREWQQQGFHVLGETIFKDTHQLEIYRESLADCPRRLVRLTCTRPVRLSREQGRSDVAVGVSDETAKRELTDLPLDHEIDTTSLTAEEVAASLLPLLEGPGPARSDSRRTGAQ